MHPVDIATDAEAGSD